MEPRVRAMREDEAPAVADLLLRANSDNLSSFPADVARAYRADLVDVPARCAFSEIYVLHLDGRLVGSVTYLPDAHDDAHPWPPGGSVLRLLAVEPEARGQGLGERLASLCIERARQRGAAFLALHTAPAMASARRLYTSLGFERAPEHDFDPGAHYGQGPRGFEPPWGLAYLLRLEPARPSG